MSNQLIKQLRANYKTKIWKLEILQRDEHACQECGEIENLTCHHIIPVEDIFLRHNIKTKQDMLKNKLLFDPENGITLCSICHQEKH